MKRALLSKNKFKFVDGSIKEPSTHDSLYDAWERSNNIVVSWILKTLSPNIAQSVTYIDSAHELWEDLKHRFFKGDHFRLSDLLQDLHSMRQGDRGISAYFTELKTLWEELEVLRPIPSCTCSTKCSCDLVKTIKRYRESEYVLCFLKDLNDQYSHVRSQILMMEELPPIKKAFPLLIQQERLCGSHPEVRKVFAAASSNQNFPNMGQNQNSNTWRGHSNNKRGGFQSNQRGSSNNNSWRPTHGGTLKMCTFCGKEGHTVETCYFKHGFPPNFVFKNKPSKSSIHNMTSTANNTDQFQEDTNSNDHINLFKNLTPEQYAQITDILKKNAPQAHNSMINQVLNSDRNMEYVPQKSGNIIDSGV